MSVQSLANRQDSPIRQSPQATTGFLWSLPHRLLLIAGTLVGGLMLLPVGYLLVRTIGVGDGADRSDGDYLVSGDAYPGESTIRATLSWGGPATEAGTAGSVALAIADLCQRRHLSCPDRPGRHDLNTDLDLRESAGKLREKMVQISPELHDTPVAYSWTGRLGVTFDLMPHIGRVNGVHYALGYCGHGVSIATYLGREIGLLLAGRKTRSPFATIPHSTRFFYKERPWFRPLAAAYYRLRDWMT